ncbi:MAG: VOC family protein [Pseudomonadota bacterium]
MRFIAYLNFNGQCRAAFDLYREVFRGEIAMRMTYGDSPMREQMPADSHNLIMHCQLEAAGAVLMGADGPPPHTPAGQGTCVNIDVDDIGEAERIYAALSDGGTVQMPLQETFWAHRWGAFTDRFGKPWMVNCMKQPG